MSAVVTTETTAPPRRHPSPPGGRRPGLSTRARLAPYLLIAPTALVLLAVQGWPLVKMVVLSLQNLTQRNLFTGTTPEWYGLRNYTTLLSDPFFWQVVARTVAFTVVNVVLTIVLATGLALLMRRSSAWCRKLITFTLICVWAMPTLVSTLIFNWMTDFSFGVINWLISLIPGVDFIHHDWFAHPLQGFAVITAIVVWGALPFVAITLYAGLTQVPRELEEAARVDGASAAQVFRNVTYPVLRPLYVIATTLSVIWDFQVFNQVWVARYSKPEPGYFTLGIYSFTKSFGVNEYSLGSAIAVVTVLMLIAFTFLYLRQGLRMGEFE
jgi:N,N'-diacetylchitobiose transport system permease protein